MEKIGELFYACNENRLLLYPGFGKKNQENVIDSITFYLSQQGNFLFAQFEPLGKKRKNFLQKRFSSEDVQITGNYLRVST